MLIKPLDLVKIFLPPYLIYIVNEFLYYLWPAQSLAWNVDIYLHLAGGMSIAAASIVILQIAERAGWIKINRTLMAFSIVVAFVVVAAVVWEFYEFLHDYFYGTHFQPSNADTMKDLFMGMLGGMAWYLFHFVQKRSAL